MRRLGVASDHAGAELKESVLALLRSWTQKGSSVGEVFDYGVPFSPPTPSTDYPDYAEILAINVSAHHIDGGIAICGTGLGMSIVSNKFVGVRAACVWDEYSCRMSREHNDTNILCLGARTLSVEQALQLVEIWLQTPFGGGKHLLRLNKIADLEKRNFLTPPNSQSPAGDS